MLLRELKLGSRNRIIKVLAAVLSVLLMTTLSTPIVLCCIGVPCSLVSFTFFLL